ncbi:hypothetical protein SODALDRAFT_268055 [Sodiomyces alkalinus F11]|uniref:Uncharacterized protein n=1 Tax=Sodiomyces alkalinus (strain CBS 110278 / VKM F-3762 / F11) TaxID=1314773 RepID=A0A3N2Q7I3_SODAK|nr:hypothetical protein SODALDRAFT_268055 [Sodiomyces alkalinus F11]ROT42702.1 hypothetical protein SODALDRAFT_268055 [Sodiomyces alkalinus F11]
MCELHPYRCPVCATHWQGHQKLASCEQSDPETRCPERLCMYVGNPKRPRRKECESCAQVRELLEEYEIDKGNKGT